MKREARGSRRAGTRGKNVEPVGRERERDSEEQGRSRRLFVPPPPPPPPPDKNRPRSRAAPPPPPAPPRYVCARTGYRRTIEASSSARISGFNGANGSSVLVLFPFTHLPPSAFRATLSLVVHGPNRETEPNRVESARLLEGGRDEADRTRLDDPYLPGVR